MIALPCASWWQPEARSTAERVRLFAESTRVYGDNFVIIEIKDGIGAAMTFFYSFLVTVKSHRFSPKKKFPFNFRQNIGTYYVLQISVIPSLILVTVQSL